MCKDLINNRSGFLNLTTYAPCDSCKRPTEAEVREGKRKAFVMVLSTLHSVDEKNYGSTRSRPKP
jgi:hypothetical protein